MDASYKVFFRHATGLDPYHYQIRLADEAWPNIVHISTGMGKTAGTVVSWLYKRAKGDTRTPRRLVYCLPMRVLVEQTAKSIRLWIENLVSAGSIQAEDCPCVYVLMGGETDADWDLYPEKDCILVGTQDQLLSRALNRGYGMSRFRWPVHFGLLNNDCLWVLDEVQLMGSGLTTAVQLHAFRDSLGTVLPSHSIWMSATLDRSWLNTVDFDATKHISAELCLSDEDSKSPILRSRFEARKPISKCPHKSDDLAGLAGFITQEHTPGTRTFVIVNSVKRAQDLYSELKKRKPKADLVLLHSRFRPSDRVAALDKLLSPPSQEGTICISTQVIEAGVDVSCTTLITELAPWSSLVQRFGRCNRYGLDDDARIFWVEHNHAKKSASLPYTEEEIEHAGKILEDLSDAAPKNLPAQSEEYTTLNVLRRKDILDLFDTTPDLAGADIDISRFIRESEDHDVQVFWRDLPQTGPTNQDAGPSREELCSVSVNDLRSVKDLDMWRWDHLEKMWGKPQAVFPGLTLMLRKDHGCYRSEMGWTGKKKDIPDVVSAAGVEEESNDDDFYVKGVWQTLPEHSNMVVEELESILKVCPIDSILSKPLGDAALLHDIGKAHEVFRDASIGDQEEVDTSILWAKTALPSIKYARRGFRHELASALALLQHGFSDLIVYLVASHHGKVRLSIRSLPNEKKPPDPRIRFARGIWNGDILEEVELGGNGAKIPETRLDLSVMELGSNQCGPSWLSRMLVLRDSQELGPFRLALLEALLRAADWRASRRATDNV